MRNDDVSLDALLKTIVERLSAIDGIAALVLGGSRAKGTARPDSDVDIGIYYEADRPFAVEALENAARELDDSGRTGLMTQFGEWGPGVNGGGWLVIGGRHVDFLYRDLERVEQVVRQCVAGRVEGLYQLGHPMGFQSQIYAGEIQCCRPLYDPHDKVARLKRLVGEYPPALRRALCEKHLFDAGFELGIADKPAARGDAFFVAGCLFGAAGFMLLVLYALNRCFFTNEKGAIEESRGFAIMPPGFHDEVAAVLSSIGTGPAALSASVARMRSVFERVERLVADELPR